MEIEEHTDLPVSEDFDSSHSVDSANSRSDLKDETSLKACRERTPTDDPTNPIDRIEKMIQIIQSFPKRRTNLDKKESKFCHYCRVQCEKRFLLHCTITDCLLYFCFRCMNQKFRTPSVSMYKIMMSETWNCPSCRGECTCQICQFKTTLEREHKAPKYECKVEETHEIEFQASEEEEEVDLFKIHTKTTKPRRKARIKTVPHKPVPKREVESPSEASESSYEVDKRNIKIDPHYLENHEHTRQAAKQSPTAIIEELSPPVKIPLNQKRMHTRSSGKKLEQIKKLIKTEKTTPKPEPPLELEHEQNRIQTRRSTRLIESNPKIMRKPSPPQAEESERSYKPDNESEKHNLGKMPQRRLTKLNKSDPKPATREEFPPSPASPQIEEESESLEENANERRILTRNSTKSKTLVRKASPPSPASPQIEPESERSSQLEKEERSQNTSSTRNQKKIVTPQREIERKNINKVNLMIQRNTPSKRVQEGKKRVLSPKPRSEDSSSSFEIKKKKSERKDGLNSNGKRVYHLSSDEDLNLEDGGEEEEIRKAYDSYRKSSSLKNIPESEHHLKEVQISLNKCHYCHSLKFFKDGQVCSNQSCKIFYCLPCIKKHPQTNSNTFNQETWKCLVCEDRCKCNGCLENRFEYTFDNEDEELNAIPIKKRNIPKSPSAEDQKIQNKEPSTESPINIPDVPEEESNAVSMPRSSEIEETQIVQSKYSSQKSIVSSKKDQEPALGMEEDSPTKNRVRNSDLIEEDLELFDGEFTGYTLKKKKETPSLASEKKNETLTPLRTSPIKLLLEKYSDQRKHSSPILDDDEQTNENKDQNLPDNRPSN